jgi:hypothetical protein
MSFIYKLIAGVALGLIVVRGGAGALLGLGKVAAPLILGYYVIRSMKKLVLPGVMRPPVSGSKEDPPTIEICSKCGAEKLKRHSCG